MPIDLLAEYTDALLRGLWDMVFLISSDGTYLDWYAQDTQLLYAPPAAFIGRHIGDIMPPALAATFLAAIARACANAEPVVVDYELASRQYQARIVDAGHGRVLSVVRDVTEASRARELSSSLAARLMSSQERERADLARDLHDNISQQLAALNMEIDRIGRLFPAPDLRSALQELSARAAGIVKELSEVSHRLHPSRLQTLGLVASLQALCRDVTRQTGIRVSFSQRNTPDPIDPRLSVALYRIAQEALHNVVKHSQAIEASVELVGEPGRLALYVADAGVGFHHREDASGIGLLSMRERAHAMRGQFVVHSGRGAGTRIGVRFPTDTQPA